MKKLGLVVLIGILLIAIGVSYICVKNKNIVNEGFASPYGKAIYYTDVGSLENNGYTFIKQNAGWSGFSITGSMFDINNINSHKPVDIYLYVDNTNPKVGDTINFLVKLVDNVQQYVGVVNQAAYHPPHPMLTSYAISPLISGLNGTTLNYSSRSPLGYYCNDKTLVRPEAVNASNALSIAIRDCTNSDMSWGTDNVLYIKIPYTITTASITGTTAIYLYISISIYLFDPSSNSFYFNLGNHFTSLTFDTANPEFSNTIKIKADCVQSTWSPDPKTACPTCGPPGTTITQTRTIISNSQNGGASCGPSTQIVPCANILPCEDPPPSGTQPVSPYPFSCTDTYDIKIIYSPVDANKNITLYAMPVLKSGATDVAGKTSTWKITSAPNFSTKTGAPNAGKWNDTVTWNFPLAQKYTIQYSLSYGGKTCSFSFDINVTGQTCSDPCTNLNTTTNYCEKITLPPPPPKTINGPRCQDVKCGPNQFKDCPVIYQPGNSTTNPCTAGNIYDFVQAKCVPSGEYCCNYSLTTGALNIGLFANARNDTKCVDNITQQYKLKVTTPTKCSTPYKPGVDNKCCDPRAATLPACSPYWEAVPSWKKTPQSCSSLPYQLGFTDYGGFEKYDIAPVEQDFTIYTKGALQSMRQKFIDLKSLFV